MKRLLKLVFMKVYHDELVQIAKEAKSDDVLIDGRKPNPLTACGYKLGLLTTLERLNLLAD